MINMKLNLGCGRDIKKGWINLDFNEGGGVDVVHDLNILPLPFEDEKFDYVLCQDILEHVDFIPLIDDIYRILKTNGNLRIRVPHFISKVNFEDPTHKHLFSVRTFDYFIKNDIFTYSRKVQYFSKIEKRIIFDKSSLLLKIFNIFLEKWINKSEKRQNLYESSILRIFPAVNIVITLIK